MPDRHHSAGAEGTEEADEEAGSPNSKSGGGVHLMRCTKSDAKWHDLTLTLSAVNFRPQKGNSPHAQEGEGKGEQCIIGLSCRPSLGCSYMASGHRWGVAIWLQAGLWARWAVQGS